MVDLTKNKKEKENFIVDIDEITNKYAYIIKFANGQEKLFAKTEVTRNELLKQLEKQFLEFSGEYRRYAKNTKRINIILYSFDFVILELVILIMEYNMPHFIDDLFVNIMASFTSILFLLWEIFENEAITEKLNKMYIIERFLKHKDDFDVPLYKFINGDEMKYSPIDLLNIDNFGSLEEICDFVDEAQKEAKPLLNDGVKLNKLLKI